MVNKTNVFKVVNESKLADEEIITAVSEIIREYSEIAEGIHNYDGMRYCLKIHDATVRTLTFTFLD